MIIVKDMPITEFISRFADKITTRYTLLYALYLADSYSPETAARKAELDQGQIAMSNRELKDLGFVKET